MTSGPAVPMTATARRAEVEHKLGTVRAWLQRQDLRAVLLTSQANFAWITGGGDSHISVVEPAGVAWVLITADEAHVLSANIERQRILDEEITDLPFAAHSWPWHEPRQALRVIDELAPAHRTVVDLPLDGFAVADASLVRLRYALQAEEIERFQALGADAAEAVETAARRAAPGTTELDIAADVAHGCRRQGIVPLVNLVAADERIPRYRHPLPTGKHVQRTVLIALTGRRHGLHASLTRMVSFGPPDDDLRARHDAVAAVDAAMIRATVPGATLADVFATAVSSYASEGFADEWRLHHQGGLTGYAGREIFATAAASHRLEAAQALAWNPSITRVKSEDTMIVGPEGPVILTRTGSWPQRRVAAAGAPLSRPALLVR